MPTVLFIKCVNPKAKEYYTNHKHYHKGDSGLYLYILEDVKIKLGETKFIDLGIQCEMLSRKLISTSPHDLDKEVDLPYTKQIYTNYLQKQM